MAIRHHRAVSEFSKSKGKIKIVLKEIAISIGYNDEPMNKGVRTLAKEADVSVNTVRAAIEWGVKNGELELSKEEGQKRWYSVLLPVQPKTDTVEKNRISFESDKTKTDTVSTSGTDTVLGEMDAKLTQLIETVSVLASTVSKLSETVSVLDPNRISFSHTCVEDIKLKEEEEEEEAAVAATTTPTAKSLKPADHPLNSKSKKAISWDLISQWGALIGSLPRQNDPAYESDYMVPAIAILDRCDWYSDRAYKLIEEKRREMLHDGKSPRRLQPVVKHIIDKQDGLRVGANGRKKSIKMGT